MGEKTAKTSIEAEKPLDDVMSDEELAKEIEAMVANMDDKQLEELDAILAQGLDKDEEFALMAKDLEDMGIEAGVIQDLQHLAALMGEFLLQVEGVEAKFQEQDLLDNIRLYLLGLPNKLGPLGFIALQHVLEQEFGHEDHDHDEGSHSSLESR